MAAPARPLVVVLPELGTDLATHYAHYVRLLEELRGLVPLAVVIEKNGAAALPELRARLPGVAVTAQREAAPHRRALELARLLVRLRRRGFRAAYGSYSPYFGVVGGLVGRLAGVRTAYWHCRSDFFDRAIGRRLTLRRLLLDTLPLLLGLHLSHRVVTGTPRLAERYARTFRLPRRRVRVVPNDVDVASFPPHAPAGGGTPTLLFVGRLSGHKGAWALAPLVRALEERGADFRLLVAGGGPEEERVRRELGGHPRVELLGPVANPDARALMGRSEVYVMPSLSEGFPRVLVEAMAAGVPFAATDVGGVPEVVGEEARGRLVPAGDVEGLADRVAELLADPALRERLAAEGLETVKRFDVPIVARRLVDEVCRD